MDGVLADHADDIAMFDVPSPHDGVRGIAAYRDTWPGFVEWPAGGASFEIVSRDVTADTDVAYASRCSVAACRRISPRTQRTACGSPSGCARRTVGGRSRTSTTRSPTPPETPGRADSSTPARWSV